jgi:uncharacterized protein
MENSLTRRCCRSPYFSGKYVALPPGNYQRMFDWDEDTLRHVAEHDVEPFEAEEVVTNNPVDLEEQFRNGEERLMQIGETNALRILVVVTTWRGSRVRVVTAFQATPQLRNLYLTPREKGR